VLCTALSFAMLLVDACAVTPASADDLLPVSVHQAPGGFTADVTGRLGAHRPPYGATHALLPGPVRRQRCLGALCGVHRAADSS
jgi:hypothetical protein